MRGVLVIVLIGVVLAVAIGLHAPALVFWLVVGLAALAFGVFRPAVLCYALPIAVTLDTALVLPVGPLRAGPTDVVVGALLGGWIIRTGWAGRGPVPEAAGLSPQSALTFAGLRAVFRRERAASLLISGLALYLGVIVLSGIVAISRSLVLKEAFKWGEVLAVVLLAADLLRQPGRQRITAWFMLAAATSEALLAYGQWVFAVGDVGATGASLRVFGTFGQPNPFAAYLNLAVPLALALALVVRDPRVRWPAAAVAALLLGAQALADSRGGLLGLAAAVAVMLVVALGIERPGVVVALGGGALVALAWVTGILPASLRQRALHLLRLDGVSLNGPLNDANFSAVERLAHWVAGLRMFLAHPLLGVGAGNYDPAYARYKVPGWNLSLGHAHNYYINAAAETGGIGLAIFLFLTGAMLYAAWRATRQAGSPDVGVNDRRMNETGMNAAETVHGLDRTAALQGRAEAGRASERSRPYVGLFGPGVAAYLWARWDHARALATNGTTFSYAIALGMLGTVVALDVHNLVDDAFVHGIALQLGLCLALVVAILRGPAPAGVEVAVDEMPGVAGGEAAGEQLASP